MKTEIEDEYFFQIKAAGLPTPAREFKAIPGRRFRFDFAFIPERLLIEIQGAVWIGGAHSRGWGIERDCDKHNLAILQGWRVLMFPTSAVKDGSALDMTERALKATAP
jgi:very-short-patch-repair endonuclease